jgi:hypothetical protein
MTILLTIPDYLAAALEARRRDLALPSIEAAAESLIVQGLAVADEDHSAGRSVEALRAALAEADASGPAEAWDAQAVRADVLRRYIARG